MVTPAIFREQFPMFSNPQSYSDAAITMWVGLAGNLLDPVRWGAMLDYGTMLYVAHRLSLVRRDVLAGNVPGGGVPGEVRGVLSAKAVDKVSASYDAQSVALKDAGQWNMSRFGIEYMQLVAQFGAGGMQVQ